MSDQYGPHSSGNNSSINSRVGSLPRSYGDGQGVPLLYTQAQVDALVKAERERCVRVAEAAKEDWKAYPDGGICDEIAARIREGK